MGSRQKPNKKVTIAQSRQQSKLQNISNLARVTDTLHFTSTLGHPLKKEMTRRD